MRTHTCVDLLWCTRSNRGSCQSEWTTFFSMFSLGRLLGKGKARDLRLRLESWQLLRRLDANLSPASRATSGSDLQRMNDYSPSPLPQKTDTRRQVRERWWGFEKTVKPCVTSWDKIKIKSHGMYTPLSSDKWRLRTHWWSQGRGPQLETLQVSFESKPFFVYVSD